jgi:hypothetical protein
MGYGILDQQHKLVDQLTIDHYVRHGSSNLNNAITSGVNSNLQNKTADKNYIKIIFIN